MKQAGISTDNKPIYNHIIAREDKTIFIEDWYEGYGLLHSIILCEEEL